MRAAQHRLSQGFGALFAFARAVDLDLARRHLSTLEFNAFSRMSRSEQLHSLQVLGKVMAADPASPRALAAAALLHDVGKSRYRLAVWQRTLAVIVESIAPGLSRALSQDENIDFWRAPFVVRRHHAKWSAEILRGCGSDEAVIWLVERHQDDAKRYHGHPHYNQLARLQSADADS